MRKLQNGRPDTSGNAVMSHQFKSTFSLIDFRACHREDGLGVVREISMSQVDVAGSVASVRLRWWIEIAASLQECKDEPMQ